VSHLLGLRIKWGKVIIDPVIPGALDGLQASMQFMGRSLTLSYIVKEESFGPKRICINGSDIAFTEEENIYRRGGALIPVAVFSGLPLKEENKVEIYL
jgi:cellobiose phosphorylase